MPKDRQFASQSLREERQAIADYGERLKTAQHPKLRKALSHARKDEKEHAAKFKSVIDVMDKPHLFGYLNR